MGWFTPFALAYCSASSINSVIKAFAVKNKCNLDFFFFFFYGEEPNRRPYACALTPVHWISNHMLDMLNLSHHTSQLLFVQLSEVCLSSSKYIKIGNFFLKGRYGFSEFLFSICYNPASVTARINSTGAKDRRQDTVRPGLTIGFWSFDISL